MEATVVLDQPFQNGSPLSAEQIRLKQLADDFLAPAFRSGRPKALYWMAIHADNLPSLSCSSS